MATYPYIQSKVDYGYGKAATKIGQPYDIFRAPSAIKPLRHRNLFAQTNLSYNVNWNYTSANKYGNSVYQLIIDGKLIVPNDFLVYVPTLALNSEFNETLFANKQEFGNYYEVLFLQMSQQKSYFGSLGLTYDRAKIFYVNQREPLAPATGVMCNRIVTITRPIGAILPGGNPYSEYQPDNVLTVFEECPASILYKGKPMSNPFSLPLDTKSPRFEMLIPNLNGAHLRIGDLVDDDNGVRYGIDTVEESEFGFRCTATNEQT